MQCNSCLYSAISACSVRGMWCMWETTEFWPCFHAVLQVPGYRTQLGTYTFQVPSCVNKYALT
eukprot:1388984-Rhodomonas_salina.1